MRINAKDTVAIVVDYQERLMPVMYEKEELLKNGADYLVDSPEDILDLYEEKCEE